MEIENSITPPCIDHLYKVLNNGENLPHSARLLLATFLIFSEKNIDEIIEIFKKLPDYNEQITRYQLEHLSGKKGGSKKYFVPSCEKIKIQNLCYETTCMQRHNQSYSVIEKEREVNRQRKKGIKIK